MFKTIPYDIHLLGKTLHITQYSNVSLGLSAIAELLVTSVITISELYTVADIYYHCKPD